MTALIVLTALTGCTTTNVTEDNTTFKETLLSMIPDLPDVPSLPALSWTYQEGLYCLDEQNVDMLLDYGENTLPHFRWELEQYQRKMNTILQSL